MAPRERSLLSACPAGSPSALGLDPATGGESGVGTALRAPTNFFLGLVAAYPLRFARRVWFKTNCAGCSELRGSRSKREAITHPHPRGASWAERWLSMRTTNDCTARMIGAAPGPADVCCCFSPSSGNQDSVAKIVPPLFFLRLIWNRLRVHTHTHTHVCLTDTERARFYRCLVCRVVVVQHHAVLL